MWDRRRSGAENTVSAAKTANGDANAEALVAPKCAFAGGNGKGGGAAAADTMEADATTG